MSTQTINVGVQGMTCGHCVRSVTEELTALPGVTDVQVELVNGGTSKVTISAPSRSPTRTSRPPSRRPATRSRHRAR